MKVVALVVWAWAGLGSLAQETTTSTGVGIGTLLVQLGLSGVFLWQWLRADKRAQDQSDKLLVLAERMLPALEECTRTLRDVKDGMTRQVERAEPTALNRGDVRQFSEAVYRLEETLRGTGRSEGRDDPYRRD